MNALEAYSYPKGTLFYCELPLAEGRSLRTTVCRDCVALGRAWSDLVAVGLGAGPLRVLDVHPHSHLAYEFGSPAEMACVLHSRSSVDHLVRRIIRTQVAPRLRTSDYMLAAANRHISRETSIAIVDAIGGVLQDELVHAAIASTRKQLRPSPLLDEGQPRLPWYKRLFRRKP